jgi:hypothetical protein
MRLKQLSAGVSEAVISGRSAKALAFSSDEKKMVLIAVDIMGFAAPNAAETINDICSRCGIGASDLMVVCSGAASGPVTCPRYGMAEPEEAFLKELGIGLPELAVSALNSLAPVSAGCYRANLPHIAHNARFLTRNLKAVNEWMDVPQNEVLSAEGPSDPDLDVLAVRDDSGSLSALLWCYSAEDRFGESLGSAVQEEIDRRLGGHIPCLRLPGCGADTAFTYDFQKTVDLLSSSVIASAMEACCDPTAAVCSERRSVILPVRDYSIFYDRAEVEMKLPGAVPIFERELGMLQKEALTALPASIQAIRLGGFAIAGLPGNAFASLALDLKRRSPVKLTCVTGFCGGTQGYLMPGDSFDNGGFEAWPARWALPARGSGEFLCDELAGVLVRLSAHKGCSR